MCTSTSDSSSSRNRKRTYPQVFFCNKCGKSVFRGSDEYDDNPICCGSETIKLFLKESKKEQGDE